MLSRETTAFEFDPITKHLFKTDNKKNAMLNLIENKELFKRNAAGHYWFNNSLKSQVIDIKNLAIELIDLLQKELQ